MVKLVLVVGSAAVLLPAIAEAQDTKPPVRRRQAPIEIRGQVPTPQVVTVRPREVPTYSRQVLVPNFYDHDFWPSILPGYRLVSQRQVTGAVPVDSATIRADKAATDSLRTRLQAAPTTTSPAPGTPADTVRRVTPVTPPADTTTARPGTPPARTSR